MGGLRRLLPATHATFAVGVLAIAGMPPLAGFFSKDEILWAALAGPGGSAILWAASVLTAGVTAFYMTRLYVLAFSGPPRMGGEARRHLHESPMVMTLPLVVLAVGSAIAGFAGVPHFLGGSRLPNYLEGYLAPVLHSAAPAANAPIMGERPAMLAALLVSAAGIVLGWALHRAARRPAVAAAEGREAPIAGLVRRELLVDEAIEAIVLRPYRALCRLSAAFDERVVDGLVNAAAVTTDLASQALRAVQTGYVRNYAFVFFLGTIVILGYALL
jgi:NADH-quinone oxidoreductase subunit L